ncbi:hypothetical protein Syun_019093 [Stephania yunnanensis]|uniref:Uncharacterized protein n=1 Tax=Stephania yunnanensis TaxID=152371 RepID=A0AAP0ITH4_9MAGN
MSHPQVPQHEGSRQFHQSLSLEDMVMQVMESVSECWQICNEIRKLDFSCPGSKDLMEDYLIDTSEECEVFQIKPEIVIALNEGEDEMKIDVNSDKSEMPQIESEENQPLVLVRPPTLPCTFGTPYKGVEVREHLQIFYTTNTFVSDEPNTIDSFMLEVLNELLNLKEGVHALLPKYVDAPFVVDISKGEGIT